MAKKKSKKKSTAVSSRNTDSSVDIRKVANGYTVSSMDKNFNTTTHIAKTKKEATEIAAKKLR